MLTTIRSALTAATAAAAGRLRDERGQTATEYLGVIVVVAAIIAVLAGTTDIGDTIKDAIIDTIDSITGGGG